MCGIAGYFGQGNYQILTEMTKSIKYRGPDDAGIFCYQNIGLGHARLAILDLTKEGHQPMSDSKEKIWLVFNGEIYNFPELKLELENDGIKFKSSSDTEVIIYLYKKYGKEFLKKINGMFALAIYDKAKNKLILARDRMGKKPLYWGVFNNTLIFGSELKVLLVHPEHKKELDLESLNKYLQFEYVPTPFTILKNTFKLEPGYWLEFDGKNIIKEKYWDIEFNKIIISEKEAISKLDNELNSAVKKRLISDVPLGVFLSGGIDSSAICYYAQKNSSTKINTFSIGFEEKSFDESKYARRVSTYLGTNHHEHIFKADECLKYIPEIFSQLDEPMADASILPTYLLSKFAREKITVALGGDGSDELFCGYDTFVAEYYSGIYEKFPSFLKIFITGLSQHLPTSFKNISFDFKIKRFFSGFSGDEKYRHYRWLGAFNQEDRQNLFKENVWQNLKTTNEFETVDRYLSETKTKDKLDKLILLYLRTYLMDDILVKVDRASMLNSLEVRTPFLDYECVDFANSLPNNFKLKHGQGKYILKKLLKNKLPKEILERRKKGFGIPLATWLANDLKSLLLEKFEKNKIEAEGLFNHKYIENLLDNHFNRKQDNRKQIWTLLVFELWYENFLKT